MSESAPPRLRAAIWGLFVTLSAASLLGTVLSPYLLVKSPLLLVAISSAAHHIALAAATVEPLTLIVVATLRRVLTGVSAYGLGYLYGHVAIVWVEQRSPRLARLFQWLERLFARFGIALLVIAPAPTLALFAGAARSRFPLFVLALFVGHALWNTLLLYVGDAFSRNTDELTALLEEHLIESTLVCVALVGLSQLFSRLRRKARPAAVSHNLR